MSTQAQIGSELIASIQNSFIRFWKIGISFLVFMIFLRGIEVLILFEIHSLDYNQLKLFLHGLLFDLEWSFYILGFLLLTFLITDRIHEKFSIVYLKIILTLLILLQGGLFFYFTKMLLPLGEDLYAYSIKDMVMTVKASGELNAINMLILSFVLIVIYLLLTLGKKISIGFKTALTLSCLCYFYLLSFTLLQANTVSSLSELEKNLLVNKSFYLYNQSYNYFAARDYLYFDFYLSPPKKKNLLVSKLYVETNYPFLHENNYPDVLGPYFDDFDTIPDIVFVIVEGLGKAYSGEAAYLGSFTPFLDSLSNHSLYWKNGLSTTGRTFGVLVGTFGSLPFAHKGFMDLAPNFPKHMTLFSILKQNGYFTNYHIGADINFDNVGSFLNFQKVDRVLGLTSFDSDFEETPSKSGFSWGFPDKALFENGMRHIPRDSSVPQLSVFQTQTSHDPFIIPDEQKYFDLLDDHIKTEIRPTEKAKEEILRYRSMYASILYVDDAIREFFAAYRKMPKYKNTIFVITGDHRLPEIPLATSLDRYHVPILIYSEKLNRPKRIHGVSSHFEITPTLLSMLGKRYEMDLPGLVSWKGYVMDTSATFQSNISNPLMRNKNQLVDYISGEYVLSDNQLYQLIDNMGMEPLNDVALKEKLIRDFENYKNSNRYAVENNLIIPDSLNRFSIK